MRSLRRVGILQLRELGKIAPRNCGVEQAGQQHLRTRADSGQGVLHKRLCASELIHAEPRRRTVGAVTCNAALFAEFLQCSVFTDPTMQRIKDYFLTLLS